MKKLLSLPTNLANNFHELTGADRTEWFCTSDPKGKKVGSGGGTAWLLNQWEKTFPNTDIAEKKIIIHAGGQSRRLPSYASAGKVLTPIPVLRWAIGQRLNQTLLSLQIPLYEKIIEKSSNPLNTLIASGDVLIRTDRPLPDIPQADVVCFGLWVDSSLATHHGVFVNDRRTPETLDFMLQKPSLEQLNTLSATHIFQMDIGIWLLSDRALKLLRERSIKNGEISYYDLYSDFGCSLGSHPTLHDEEIASLSVAIVPLTGGEFYHYGTTPELISSTVALQSKITDQQLIMHRKIKPSPAIFVQNAIIDIKLSSDNENVWIENSHISSGWQLEKQHVLTGIPHNKWNIKLPAGTCLDIVAIGEKEWAVRPYGFNDPMRGAIDEESTLFLGEPLKHWLTKRGVTLSDSIATDIQSAHIFPIVGSIDDMDAVIAWMTGQPDYNKSENGKMIWLQARRLSADDISEETSLLRQQQQRTDYMRHTIPALAANHEKSIFYQLDLANLASIMTHLEIEAPDALNDDTPIMTAIRNRMLRAKLGMPNEEEKAFELLRTGILSSLDNNQCQLRCTVYPDQIVWGRSPVRIDLAGGWTDTPPYSLTAGGNVVNMAIELNGQPPLQVFIKPCSEPHIVLRSIDMGASETVDSYTRLLDFRRIGSPFSIPKAALALVGFAPKFSPERYNSLQEQLKAFGFGIEITLLSAIPAGSGLGTSSILAATVLGALNDFCGLAWDSTEICNRTLALEQLLTTGGGWQDQYGGLLQGVKLLQTERGFDQRPLVRWLPEQIFTSAESRPCHLLYYTGITRTAKSILAEIVRGMFLNSSIHLHILDEMKQHALDMSDTIQRGNFQKYAALVKETWQQNKKLDLGTNPPAIEAIIKRIDDYSAGYKLPGAGGGGYLYIIAKDPNAAAKIRKTLTNEPPNHCARFVEMSLSDTGFQVSRS